MDFYKIILVVEADYPDAEELGHRIAQRYDGIWDVWFKAIEDMSDEEVLQFFERTREEMLGHDEVRKE